LRGGRGVRLRRGRPGGGAGEDLRAVLHLQGGRHWAGAGGRPRNRERSRRLDGDRGEQAPGVGVPGVLARGGGRGGSSMTDRLEPAERSRATILVVEDDAAMRDLVVEELSDAGFRVEAAPGGRAGVDRVKEGGIDVVVSDLRMPDLDGFDLLRDIKAAEG